jgi:hypothetical protein
MHAYIYVYAHLHIYMHICIYTYKHTDIHTCPNTPLTCIKEMEEAEAQAHTQDVCVEFVGCTNSLRGSHQEEEASRPQDVSPCLIHELTRPNAKVGTENRQGWGGMGGDGSKVTRHVSSSSYDMHASSSPLSDGSKVTTPDSPGKVLTEIKAEVLLSRERDGGEGGGLLGGEAGNSIPGVQVLRDSKAEVLLSRERSSGEGKGGVDVVGSLATLQQTASAPACGVDMLEEMNPPPLPLVSIPSSPSECSFSSSAFLMNPPPLPMSSCARTSPQRPPPGGDHLSAEVWVCAWVGVWVGVKVCAWVCGCVCVWACV